MQIAKRALTISDDAEIADGFAWLVTIVVRCIGQDAIAASDVGDNARARAALVQGLAMLNEGQETIARQSLSRQRVSDLAQLREAFLFQLGSILARGGDFVRGLNHMWQAALSGF